MLPRGAPIVRSPASKRQRIYQRPRSSRASPGGGIGAMRTQHCPFGQKSSSFVPRTLRFGPPQTVPDRPQTAPHRPDVTKGPVLSGPAVHRVDGCASHWPHWPQQPLQKRDSAAGGCAGSPSARVPPPEGARAHILRGLAVCAGLPSARAHILRGLAVCAGSHSARACRLRGLAVCAARHRAVAFGGADPASPRQLRAAPHRTAPSTS
jgi:hypothetical protein